MSVIWMHGMTVGAGRGEGDAVGSYRRQRLVRPPSPSRLCFVPPTVSKALEWEQGILFECAAASSLLPGLLPSAMSRGPCAHEAFTPACMASSADPPLSPSCVLASPGRL